MIHLGGFKPRVHFRQPDAPDCCVARGIPSYYDHGRFTLFGLNLEADGKPLAALDPAPLADGDGLWRWRQGESDVWGYGLLRPATWSNNDTIDAPALKDLTVACPEASVYGSVVLLGLAYEFEIDHCQVLHGARGLDQLRMDTCYITRVHHSRFYGQHDACINLDYGISTLEALRLQGVQARHPVRLRANAAEIHDVFFAESSGMEVAVRLCEMGMTTLDRVSFDFESLQLAPKHLVHASRGHGNGGASILRIVDTPASLTTDALVRLDDAWEGRGGSGVGPGHLKIENSLHLFLNPRHTPAIARAKGPSWSVEHAGPGPKEVPLTIGEPTTNTNPRR